MPTFEHPLTDTIMHLRRTGEMILVTEALKFSVDDEQRLSQLLAQDYIQEAKDWPHTCPEWDATAGIWAAKILFHTAKLILYRKQKIDAVRHLFAEYPGHITPSAVLSADLCLRFLPQCIVPLEGLNDQDELIGILQAILGSWHYSAIGYSDLPTPTHFAVIHSNSCLSQLYVDRVIGRKHRAIALQPEIRPMVAASLGEYASVFWPDFYLETITNEQYSDAQ